jgi:rSAM/selenodomain-associated transferase 2
MSTTTTGPARISVIIPTLEEESAIASTIVSAAGADEILVIDGGSRDRTCEIATAVGARLVTSVPGRGRQLAAGARAARGDVLLFLHADTRLPAGFAHEVRRIVTSGRCSWGRFDLRFDRDTLLLALIARLISWRSRLTRGATGDQAIFVRRDAYERVGGISEDVLFEDVSLCRRLKRDGRMGVPAGVVITSSRRWRRGGTIRTSLLMWTLKGLYLAGVPAARLARFYPNVR